MQTHLGKPGGSSRWRIWRSWRDRSARSLAWKVSVPVACACVGLLATTSMINARGTDLRGGRHSDLTGIVSAQSAKVRQLQQESKSLQVDVEALTEQVRGSKVNSLQRGLARLEVPAGLRALEGPGLRVSLDDAPLGQPIADEVDPNLLVVHQQDIQAVVNALWAGGAEGISLQGQRIISTTGIKCVGNTVVLQGVPYSPPYDIVAVGNDARMYDALVSSPQVANYRDYTQPPYNLGWSLKSDPTLKVPAFVGPIGLEFAQAANR